MADEKLETPVNVVSGASKTSRRSSHRRKSLLNAYLQSSKPDSAKKTSKTKKSATKKSTKTKKTSKKNKKNVAVASTLPPDVVPTPTTTSVAPQIASRINRPRVKQLGDLQELLSEHPDSLELAAGVKQLGSIESILQGKIQPAPLELKPDTASPYEKEDFYAKADKTDQISQENDPLDVSAFTSDEPATTSNLNRNIPIFAATVFGIGACVFGINQLIKNANFNFASENATQEQEAVAPPRILTFQGRLTDYDQKSITTPKKMRFVLYNTSGGNTPPPIGGEVLWDSGVCTITPNASGIFTVNLGAGKGDGHDDYNCGQTLGNIFAQNSNVWVQISVDDEVLFPRQLIKSVPFALNSETLQGYPASQSATANTIPVLDNNGNLKFGTAATSIINIGDLSLISQTGDIYLIPGSGDIYLGTASQSANLHVNGDINLDKSNSTVNFTDTLAFRSSAAKTIWNTAYIDKNGNLGLGTATPKQKLTINNGSIAFEFLSGPDVSKMTLSEDVTDTAALKRIANPDTAPSPHVQESSGSTLTAGTYKYAYSFVTSDGAQTALSPIASVTLTGDGQTAIISDLAISNHPSVVARNLYRTKNGGDELFLVKTISDNSSTSTYDNINDFELTQPASNLNTTGTYRYKLTFVNPDGESSASNASSAITLSGDGRTVRISNIPLPSSDQVTARRLYRSLANSEDYYLVNEFTDNATTFYDHASDDELQKKTKMPSAGGIYTNGRLSLQFAHDGTIQTSQNVIVGNRMEASYGDNQGLKLPTSAGKPYAKIGQQVGDIVYDSVGQVLYIYNGIDFVPTGITNDNSVTLSNSSHCSGSSCRLVLDAEYAGAIVSGDGTNNNGTFSSGSELIAENYHFNYYAWRSSDAATLNDFDTTINLTLPNNFSSWSKDGLTLDFATSSIDPSLNSVALEVFRGGTSIGITKTNLVSTSNNIWMSRALGTIPATISGEELTNLGFKAGDLLTIKIKTASQQNQEVKIGQINLNYQTDGGVIDTGTQSLWKQVAGAIFPSTQSDVILGGDSTASAKIGFFNLSSGTPTLYVRGNIFLDNADKKSNLDFSDQTSFNIRTKNASGNTTTRFTILPNGNIGIGTTNPTETLEVAGNAKIDGTLQLAPIDAATAGECKADTEGKIYYDAQQKAFYACQANLTTGTYSWQALN